MQRTNLWNDCASRVTLYQRARKADLQLERIERLFVLYAAVTDSWLQAPPLSFFSTGICSDALRESRT
jgi:hypothetical protein